MDSLTRRLSFQGVFKKSFCNSFIQLLSAWVSERLGTYYFALWKGLLPFSLGMCSGKGLLAHPGPHCILRGSILCLPHCCAFLEPAVSDNTGQHGAKSAWRFTQDIVGYPMCPSDTCHRWYDGFLTWVLVAETQEIRLEAQRRTYAVGQEWIPSQHQGEGQANTPAVSWCIKFTPKY